VTERPHVIVNHGHPDVAHADVLTVTLIGRQLLEFVSHRNFPRRAARRDESLDHRSDRDCVQVVKVGVGYFGGAVDCGLGAAEELSLKPGVLDFAHAPKKSEQRQFAGRHRS
jgi:hypothetical protein